MKFKTSQSILGFQGIRVSTGIPTVTPRIKNLNQRERGKVRQQGKRKEV
jgi:hypothetical protein